MSAPSDSAASRLCAACGMCCNGVLFHSVVLQPGDSARGLTARGLRIKRRNGGAFFLQPCAVHRDHSCAIYDLRPQRCRLFDCRQLLRLRNGETTETAALNKIRDARARVGEVNRLIELAGGANSQRSLAQRVANALTVPQKEPVHRELETAMRDLEALLEKDFRVP